MSLYSSNLTAPINCVVNAAPCNDDTMGSTRYPFETSTPNNYGNNFHLNTCGPTTQPNWCNKCKNFIKSDVVDGEVSASERGIAYCPFGVNGGNPPSIFSQPTKSLVPQMDPRPLNKIGWEWRN